MARAESNLSRNCGGDGRAMGRALVTKRAQVGYGPGPWCSICGRTVTDVRPTLDARHPTGVCSFVNQYGEAGGHRRVPAIVARDELTATLDSRARRTALDRHYRHLAAVPVRGCRICAERRREGTPGYA